MDELFLKRMGLHANSPSHKALDQSNLIMEKIFDHDPNFKQGNLYDVDGNFLEFIDYKYQYHAAHSIAKDNVDFYCQFRPYYHPDVIYAGEDGVQRLGFYLDVPNDNNVIERWLICGRNDAITFTRYNILKCNWTFNWVDNGTVYHSLGCLRNRNNYNSGVWSDGFTTTVQNEMQFIVPSNETTKTIDYDCRFMLSDNQIHPKVYSVTKLEDTFPCGVTKVTLVQDHYDEAVDNVELKICNYYNNKIIPVEPDQHESHNIKILFSGAEPFLHRGGSRRSISVESSIGLSSLQWTFYLNGVQKTVEELPGIDVVFAEDGKSFSIKASYDSNIGDVITIQVGEKGSTYYDTLDVEVKA